MEEGWFCPICHSVNAPLVRQCPDCQAKKNYQIPSIPGTGTGDAPPWNQLPKTGDPLPGQTIIISSSGTVCEELVHYGKVNR